MLFLNSAPVSRDGFDGQIKKANGFSFSFSPSNLFVYTLLCLPLCPLRNDLSSEALCEGGSDWVVKEVVDQLLELCS